MILMSLLILFAHFDANKLIIAHQTHLRKVLIVSKCLIKPHLLTLHASTYVVTG